MAGKASLIPTCSSSFQVVSSEQQQQQQNMCTLSSSTCVTWAAPIIASAELVSRTQVLHGSSTTESRVHPVSYSHQRRFSDGFFSQVSQYTRRPPSQSNEDDVFYSEPSDCCSAFTREETSTSCVPLDLRLPKVKPWKLPSPVAGDDTEWQEEDKNMLRRHSDSAIMASNSYMGGLGSKRPRYSQSKLQSSSSERDSLEELRHLQALTIHEEQAADDAGVASEPELLPGKRLKLKNYLLHRYQHSLQQAERRSESWPNYAPESPSSPRQQTVLQSPLFLVPAAPNNMNLAERGISSYPHHLQNPRPKHSSVSSLRRRHRDSNYKSSSSTSEGESDSSSAVTSPSLSSTSTFTTPANSPLRDQATPSSVYFQFPSSPRALPITSVARSKQEEKGNMARRALRAHLKRKMSSGCCYSSAPTCSSSTDTEEHCDVKQVMTPLSSAVVSLMSDLTLTHSNYHQFKVTSTVSTTSTDTCIMAHQKQQLFRPVHSQSWKHSAIHHTLSDPVVSVASDEAVGLVCPRQTAAAVAADSGVASDSDTSLQQCSAQQPEYHSQSSPANKNTPTCTLCGRLFSRCDMLSRHMRLHTGVRPYVCTTCGQTFSRSDHLNTHMRSHTGEKPYKCAHCPYAAPRRDMITRHQKTHTATTTATISGGDTQGRSGTRQRRHQTNSGSSCGLFGAQQLPSEDSDSKKQERSYRQYKSLSSTESSDGESGQNLDLVGGVRDWFFSTEARGVPTPHWPFWPGMQLHGADCQQLSAEEYNSASVNSVTGKFIAYEVGEGDREVTLQEDDPRKPCWLLPTLTESQDQSPLTRSPSTLSVISNNTEESNSVTVTNTAARHNDANND